MSSNGSTAPVTDAPPESSCAACSHSWEAHDSIGVRYCSATAAGGLDRECACARPAEHGKTYYRR
ncbi:RGCVC family protein [Nocardia sp. NPDC088792]|uniref:RGCVC family protein n=1 Tax=Nocardia sp. NPDC088792 TaxID=3364332 RepID=UPI0037FFD4CD